MKRILRHIPSLLLGTCFIVSGWLKGVDPYGTSLKLSEYLRVWGWNGFVADYPLAWSVCLCASGCSCSQACSARSWPGVWWR